MIIKVCYGMGGMKTHRRIVECDDVCINDVEENNVRFQEIVAHRKDADSPVARLHVGKRSTDVLYFMDKGKTVDKMTFSPEPCKCCNIGNVVSTAGGLEVQQCHDADCGKIKED